MSKRFGRNQKRKLTEQMNLAHRLKQSADRRAGDAEIKLAKVMREQLEKGTIPLEVEHFLGRVDRDLILRAILDERRANLHYQHMLSPCELRITRDKDERERFGLYLGRAIADRLAEAYAGALSGKSVKRAQAE